MMEQKLVHHLSKTEVNNTKISTMFVSNQGVQLHVTTIGNCANPALIIMHGFPDSSNGMMAVAEALADEYFVIVPDGRGINLSDAPTDVVAYEITILASDVIAIADALIPSQQFVLVGHDWGGAVAWATISLYPERIKRSVMYTGPHPAIFLDAITHDDAQQRAALYMHVLRTPSFEATFMQNDFVLPLSAFDNCLTPAEETQVIAAWQQPGRVTGALNWYRAADFVMAGGSCTIPLPDGRVPVRLLWGELENHLLVAMAYRHQHKMPWIELQVIRGMAHWFPRTHPKMFADLIRRPE